MKAAILTFISLASCAHSASVTSRTRIAGQESLSIRADLAYIQNNDVKLRIFNKSNDNICLSNELIFNKYNSFMKFQIKYRNKVINEKVENEGFILPPLNGSYILRSNTEVIQIYPLAVRFNINPIRLRSGAYSIRTRFMFSKCNSNQTEIYESNWYKIRVN